MCAIISLDGASTSTRITLICAIHHNCQLIPVAKLKPIPYDTIRYPTEESSIMSACAQSTAGLTTHPVTALVLVSESDPDSVSVWVSPSLCESIVMHIAQLFIKRFCDFCWPNGVLRCLVLHAMLVKTMPRTMQQRQQRAAVIQLVSSNGLSPSHKQSKAASSSG